MTSRDLTEDVNDNLVVTEEAERDPELRPLVEAWKAGDDRRRIISRAEWAIAERERDLREAFARAGRDPP